MSQSQLIRAPQNIETIARLLNLRLNGQIFRSLVDAILRATGYRKKHLTFRGRVAPRDILANGRASTKFATDFEVMVLRFLDEFKVGSHCFSPRLEFLPDGEGWRDSSSHLILDPKDFLQWDLPKNRKTIEDGVLLLVEYLKANPCALEEPITWRVVWDKYNGPCYDCGSGYSTDQNDIIYCKRCGLGWHQDCCKTKLIPEGDWFCGNCELLGGSKVPGQDISDASEVDSVLDPLTTKRHNRTVLLVSHNTKSQRTIRFSRLTDLESLFALSQTLWGSEVSRILLQTIPAGKENLAILRGGSKEQLVKFIEKAWGDDIDGTVYVSVHFCEEGVEA